MKNMLSALFPLVIAVAAVPAHAADWEVLDALPEQSLMVDKNSIHRDADLWKAWAVSSYTETRYLAHEMIPHKSVLALYQVDCRAGQLGYAAWSFQSGELGGGSTIWADKAESVAYFPPERGSPEEALLVRVCGTAVVRKTYR